MLTASIYLPRGVEFGLEELLEKLNKPAVSALIEKFSKLGIPIEPEFLRNQFQEFAPYSDREIATALGLMQTKINSDSSPPQEENGGEDNAAFRRAEFVQLLKQQKTESLVIEEVHLSRYGASIQPYFSAIRLVRKLRETRILVGFTRMYPENDQPLRNGWEISGKPKRWANTNNCLDTLSSERGFFL